jgi:hypothetical protein
MLEIHKLPGMQHEQNSTHPASLSCCNAGKHTAFCFCKVCKNFDHESSLLIALISAFISFRLLVNKVFRDSGRSSSACCLPDCPWRSFSSFSLALCVSGCLLPVFLFQTEIPFPLLLAKRTSIVLICQIPPVPILTPQPNTFVLEHVTTFHSHSHCQPLLPSQYSSYCHSLASQRQRRSSRP